MSCFDLPVLVSSLMRVVEHEIESLVADGPSTTTGSRTVDLRGPTPAVVFELVLRDCS